MAEEELDDEDLVYVDHVYEFADGSPIPIGDVRVTKVYDEVEKAWTEGYRAVSAQGGTRSAKTVTMMIWLVEKLVGARMTAVVMRKTMPVVKKTIYKDFRDVMRQMDIWEPERMNKTDMEYTFENGSVITFMGVDDAEKLKGLKARIAWFNEATAFSASEKQQVSYRCRFVMYDYNPNFSESHWLNELNEQDSTYHFITTYRDNPFLNRDQVAEIESMRTRNYQQWIQFGTGQRCLSQGRIFQDIKVVDCYEWPLETYIGVDFGYGAKPSAVVKVSIVKDVLAVQQLLYAKDVEPKDIARVLDENPGLSVVADSANPLYIRLVKNEMRDAGRLRGVNKRGRSGAQARIGAVHAMSKCQVVIVADEEHPSAELQKEIGEYCYKEDANGNVTNVPIDENDHCIDAARYVYMEKAPRKRRRGVRVR